MKTLGVPLLATLALGSWTRIGQMILAGRVGGAIRRFGPRPIAVVSLLTVSTGTLFYAWAIECGGWLIAGAATVWIGWIGVNLVIADLTIQLAPEEDRSGAIAVLFTATTLSFGVSSLLGGRLFDLLRDSVVTLPLIERTITFPAAIFLSVALLRAATVLFWIKRWK